MGSRQLLSIPYGLQVTFKLLMLAILIFSVLTKRPLKYSILYG